jgi:hypothetical protein
MPVDLQEFQNLQQAQEMTRKQAKLNTVRPPNMPRAIKAMSEERAVYIFSVNPSVFLLDGASYGTFTAHGCPEGREYSDPLVIPGVPWEPYKVDGNKMEAQFHGDDQMDDPGMDFALQLLGIGKMRAPAASLKRFGLFVSRMNPPAMSDVAAARAALVANDNADIEEANEAYSRGEFSKIKQDYHFEAAKRLGKTAAQCPWLTGTIVTAPVDKDVCKWCGFKQDAGFPKCQNCKEVINQALFDSMTAEPKRGPGRPRSES